MQTKEFCVYNETRENYLSPKVTVIDTRSDPLKAVKVLIEGLGPDAEAGLWLNPLKSVPAVPRLAPYDLVYLDQDCRVMHAMALVPDDEVPRFDGHAASALLLPIHSFSSSRSHPGDQVIICDADEMKRRPGRLPLLAPLALVRQVKIPFAGWFKPRAGIRPHQNAKRANHAQIPIDSSLPGSTVALPGPQKDAPKIRFLRDIVHLRVHISISIAPDPAPRSTGSRSTQSTGNPARKLSALWPAFMRRFLRPASQPSAPAKEILVPQRVQSSIDTASSSVAGTLRSAFSALSVQWTSLKTRCSFCLEAFRLRLIRPSVAAVSQLAAKATRSCTTQCRSWKLQYSQWARSFMFRPAPIPDRPKPSPAKRPRSRARRQQRLRARSLR
jgi:hypothetical protein